MIILGIDPGTQRVGYGVVRKTAGRLECLAAGILAVRGEHPLLDIKKETARLIARFKPEVFAVEKIFFSRNQKTAMRVAEARGVLMVTALEKGLVVREYAPNEIKLGVAGYGQADKKAVLKMVRLILRAPHLMVIDDASDALAIAIFAAQDRGTPETPALVHKAPG